MATLKHIASKNSDYTAIEAYLVYQHDAFTGKQLLDEQGRPKLRESYLLDTLEMCIRDRLSPRPTVPGSLLPA